jgi:hypothetical protein
MHEGHDFYQAFDQLSNAHVFSWRIYYIFFYQNINLMIWVVNI